MVDDHVLHFGEYRLDLQNACLWRGTQALHLTPKAFVVLHTLVQHAGQLVTKDALLQSAWPEMTVSDAALTICLSEIRRALGETARVPRYIATVHRRGYRFVAAVQAGASAPRAAAPLLVGYDAELARLHAGFAAAQAGQRQVVLVTGEAGMGKTTLVDAFLARLTATDACGVAWGQCLAHHGVGEAYLPVLDALGRLGRGPAQARLVAVLRQYAPTWLAQLPSLWRLGPGAAPAPELSTTPARMLREMGEALDVLTGTQPLVLVLEDLHWSDHATLDLLAWLARRREPARLLVVGTYRPVEAMVHGHPLQTVVQDLARHQQCVEVRLDGLPAGAVGAYLAARLPGGPLPAGLVDLLTQRTAGQPLFMVQVVDAWLQDGRVVETGGQWVVPGGLAALATDVPTSVRQLLDQQLADCDPEAQRVLEAASVVGETFGAAAVAAGLEVAVAVVEAQCEALVRRGQFLRECGVEAWPDGTVAGQYGFRHGVHQQVVYDRLGAGWRMQLHRRVGGRKEAGYGTQVPEIAAELARHFEEGHDAGRAVRYRQQAAQTALQRCAYQEATAHLSQGLALLATLPETPLHAQQELDMHLALGPVLIATKGYAAPEVERTYRRARVLCEQVEAPSQLFPTLRGLSRFYLGRGEVPTARELAEELDQFAPRATDPMSRLEARHALGTAVFFLGDYAAARRHLEEVGAFTDLTVLRDLVRRQVEPPWPRCLVTAANALWCLGYPAQALQRAQEALEQARALDHPYSLGIAQQWIAQLHYRRREAPAALALADALLELATTQGFSQLVGFGTCWRGWARVMQGAGDAGLAEIRQGLETSVATGHGLSRPLYLVLLAEAAGHTGRVAEGLRLLAEALAAFAAGGRGDMLSEAYRLQGEFLLTPEGTRHTGNASRETDAEACFQQALAVARRQQARAWELRAALSLARLWQQQGQHAEARTLLTPLYGWFTEGFDTADLQEARALLHALGASPAAGMTR